VPSSANTMTVPATRGRMGESQYYTANFPMGMVTKLFVYDPERMGNLPVEYREQRALKKSRVPEIADYIVENDDYIFSSITVSVEATELTFHPSDIDGNLGLLEIPMEAEWIVNDGQHRVAGMALFAVASAGHDAIASGGDWKTILDNLRDIDWTKDNPEWQGICMQGSEVITRSTTRKATADLVKWKVGLGPRPAGHVV
jgi:hypothetical protein